MIGTNLQKWAQMLKVEIKNVLADYRQVYIHQTKFDCLQNDLLNFFKSVTATTFEDRDATPLENKIFKKLISILNNLHYVLESLSEANFLETILKYNPNIRQLFASFRQQFNRHVAKLGYPNIVFLPKLEEAQETADDIADAQALVTILEGVPEKSPELLKIIDFYKETVTNYTQNQPQTEIKKTSRILSVEQIQESTKEFAKYKLSHSDLRLQKKTGSGGFADVYCGYQKSTGKVVAIKKLHAKEFTRSTFSMFKRELKIFAELDHFAILPFVGVCTTPPFFLVTEFMSGGCLFDRLHSDSPPDPTKLTIIALGIAHGMAYLHSCGMVHRDLKSLNILLDADDFPRICDFGMSRYKPKSNHEYMTGGIGTVQWMAPEVLASEHYTEKADVYSYGVTLWEMLTHDVPYRSMKDVQIGLAVTKQNLRPLVPQNCQPKLKKLMQLCWEKDWKKRPDFETISRAFDSGEISFPGTTQEAVNAYLNQFIPQATQNIPQKQLIEIPDENTISTIIKKLRSDPPSQIQAIVLAKNLLHDITAKELVMSSQLFEAIVDALEDCSSASLANEILIVINEIVQMPDLRALLAKEHYGAALLELFMKFGTTAMKKFTETFTVAIKDDDVKINGKQFAKLSTFLVSNDLSMRLSMTKLLILIINKKSYVNDGALNNIVSNTFKNTVIDTVPQLLTSSLKLLRKLAALPHPSNHINKLDGALALIPLLKHNQKHIVSIAFEVLKKLMNDSQPTPKLTSLFISEFVDLFQTMDKSQPLIILSYLVKAPSVFTEMVQNPQIIDVFRDCINDQDLSISILSLKLCFSFLGHPHSGPSLVVLTSAFVKLLNSENENISLLAASNLTISIPLLQDIKSEVLKPEIATFLKNNLVLDDDYNHLSSSLRLCGVLSCQKRGAYFLAKEGIIDMIIKLLNSDINEIKRLSLAVMVSQSASFIHTKCLTECIESVFEGLSLPSIAELSIAFLANMSAITKGAEIIATHLKEILLFLVEDDQEEIMDALTLLYRLAHNPDCYGKIEEFNDLGKLISTLLELGENGFIEVVVNIFTGLFNVHKIKELTKNMKIGETINRSIENLRNEKQKGVCSSIICQLRSGIDL